MRWFMIIVAAEIAAWGAVSMVCVLVLHHSRYIVPLDIFIVGVHFLPLAKLFQVPRYYAMGVLFCVIPVATMLAVQYSAHVGHGVIWMVVPSVGCGLVLRHGDGNGRVERTRSGRRFRDFSGEIHAISTDCHEIKVNQFATQ